MIKVLTSLFIATLFMASDYLITGQFSPFYLGLFFLLVLFLQKGGLLFLASLSLLHQLFFSYFQRELNSADIYNFFTHIDETFESFFSLIMIVYKPLVLFILVLIMIRPKPIILKPMFRYPLLMILIMINLNSTLGLKLLPAVYGLFGDTNSPIMTKETPLYPKRDAGQNIILIIGESMKYNAFVEQRLQAQGHFYKKIYAGATNTDVSVPLLLNAKTNPLRLHAKNETNLFRLAKKNGYKTTFVSIQGEKWLQYIKPYLQLENIDYFKSYNEKQRASKFDFALLEELDHIDFDKPNFIVLQQIGEHSPYNYFIGEKSTAEENYKKSVLYSFALYEKLYQRLQKTQKPFVLIYTSDHGEFTGEGGRWGHNAFEKSVYEVPLFITSEIPMMQDIDSHHHVSQLLIYLLGYHDKLVFSKQKPIVNGTMITREDGFIQVEKGQP